MRGFVDTNLFIYATFSKFPQFRKAQDFLRACLHGNDLWFISWGVIYEYLRVATHPQLFPEGPLPFSKGLENVLKFSRSPRIEIVQETSAHPRFLEELSRESPELKGNILHDAHIVTLMREHDLNRIYTADTDFRRFRGIEAINPLQ